MPELLERPLDEFDRREILELAQSMRVESPKLRELADWMDEKGIDKLGDANRDELIEKARELGFSVYADTAEAIKRSGLRGPGES
jgi:5,10-methenyltetrahydromethanopterin hydrogenase